jgi:hypothetical protein
MSMKSILTLTAVAGALALGWLAHGWLAPAPPPQVYEVTAVRRDTIKGDSVPYEVRVPVPIARYVALPPDTVFIGADTAAILADYFATRQYADTLMNDTSALIALSEAVSQNRIAERTLTFQNRRATYITTTIVQPAQPKLQLYAGAVAGKGLAAPVVQMGYKRWIVGAGYNLNGGGVIAGVGYKLR